MVGTESFIARVSVEWDIVSWSGTAQPVSYLGVGTADSAAHASWRAAMEALEVLVAANPAVAARVTVETSSSDSRSRVPWEQLSSGLRMTGSPQIRRYCVGDLMLTSEQALVPAYAVHCWWQLIDPTDSPPSESDATGLAAGLSRDWNRVVCHALAEVLERDAAVLAWRVPFWPTRPLDAGILGSLADQTSVTFQLFDIGAPGLWPVVLALVTDRQLGTFTCGTACSSNLRAGARHAVEEGLMLRDAAAAADGNQSPKVVKDSWDHVAFANAHQAEVADWFQMQADRSRAGPTRPGRSARTVAAWWKERHGEPVVVALTSKRDDIQVVRVVLPEAVRKDWDNRSVAINGVRLQEALGDREANLLPHPYG